MVQPGAQPDQRTYCPVSGVVFKVLPNSPSRVIAGKSVYFCCDGCANYFSENRARVISRRAWRE